MADGAPEAWAHEIASQAEEQKRQNDLLADKLDLQTRINSAEQTYQQTMAGLQDRAEVATDSNKGERERELARRAASENSLADTKFLVNGGNMSSDDANGLADAAGSRATDQYDAEARARRSESDTDAAAASNAKVELQAELAKVQGAGSGGATTQGSAALQNSLAIEQKRYGLMAENAQLANAEKFDVDKRLDQYRQELAAEKALNQAQESRLNLASAIEIRPSTSKTSAGIFGMA